jgi:hypothetical protein
MTIKDKWYKKRSAILILDNNIVTSLNDALQFSELIEREEMNASVIGIP